MRNIEKIELSATDFFNVGAQLHELEYTVVAEWDVVPQVPATHDNPVEGGAELYSDLTVLIDQEEASEYLDAASEVQFDIENFGCTVQLSKKKDGSIDVSIELDDINELHDACENHFSEDPSIEHELEFNM